MSSVELKPDSQPGPDPQLDPNFNPHKISRPADKLLTYYMTCCAFSGPFFPIAIIPYYLKFKTLKYSFDEEGVSMSWGYLFRKEIYLTYRRIQDIHLTRNLFQRWFGLATVAVQTASGNAGPEMSIEGVLEADELRNYLYDQMRGAREEPTESHGETSEETPLQLLTQIRDALHQIGEQPNE